MGDVTLVFGPPGAGKSTWLKNSAIDMIRQDPGAAETMLAVSFSTAAAQVLRERMGLAQERAGTIHSFGRHYLENAPIVDAPPDKGKGNTPLIDAWNDDFPHWHITLDKRNAPDNHQLSAGDGANRNLGNKMLDAANILRHRLIEPENWIEHTAGMDYVVQREIMEWWLEWTRFKNRHSAIDFTDMIEIPYLDHAPVPFGAEIVYADECQDFTPLVAGRILQFAESMDKYGQLFCALDDDQLIYGHLGCVPETFIDLKNVGREYLTQSWRLPQAVHAYSQEWIKKVSRREDKEFYPRDEVGSVEHVSWSLSRTNGAHIKRLAETVLEEAYGRGQSVMLLASTNLLAGQIVATLRDHGIPFANPYRPTNGAWNPLGRATATSGPNAAILSWAKPAEGSPWTVRDILRIGNVIKTRGVFRNWASLQRRIEAMNPEDLSDEIDDVFIRQEFATIGAYGDLASGDPAHLRTLLPVEPGRGRLKGGYNLDIWEHHGSSALLETPRVTVGTIHSTKGAEADTVIVFPDISLAAKNGMTNIRERDHVIRTFYVGFTRARHKLIVANPNPDRGSPYVRLP